MALNPLTFTEKVVGDFLKYQLTAYPFTDPKLNEQMRALLSLAATRETPLLKGPYISLSRAFRTGSSVKALVEEGSLHPFMENLVPYPHLYGHQEKAIRAIASAKTTLVSTGTGSGKTECFLYPVMSRCLALRDENAPAGIIAIFVYPMNALAEDQLGRLRGLLAGTGIPFGMYVGKTPENNAGIAGEQLPRGSSRADYEAAAERARAEKRGSAVHPPEERASREQMRKPGEQPRILLTNVKQLELLLTRQADVELFDGVRLEYLVFDEAHTYSGATGAETASLIRRLRAFCGRGSKETVCIGTSATLIDPVSGPAEALEFATRFFGVPKDNIEAVGEEHQEDDWGEKRVPSPPLPKEPGEHLKEVLAALDDGESPGVKVAFAYERMGGHGVSAEGWQESLYRELSRNELCYRLASTLKRPVPLGELSEAMGEAFGRDVPEEEILCWLALGAASRREGRPLLRPVVHAFVRGVGGAVVTFPPGEDGPKLWLSAEEEQEHGKGDSTEELTRLAITTCRTCGQHYFIHFVADIAITSKGLAGGEAVSTRQFWRAKEEAQGGRRILLLDRLVSSDEEDEEDPARTQPVFLCRFCGALHPGGPGAIARCDACGREGDLVRLLAMEDREKHPGFLISCLSCKTPGHEWGSRYREPAREVKAITVSDVHVLAQNMIHHADPKRLLVFADNRQDAALQAGWMRDHARRFRLRALMASHFKDGAISVGDLVVRLNEHLENDDDTSRVLIPEVWNVARKESAGIEHADQRKRFLRILVLREITTGVRQRVGLEPWGRLRVDYTGLKRELPFVQDWASRLSLDPARLTDGIAAILDGQRRAMVLLDRDGRIFSRFWNEGDREVQRGFLPLLKGVPKGIKLQRAPEDDRNRVQQWLSPKGDTLPRKAARVFGVEKEQTPDFISGLWELLTGELAILVPATLYGARGKVLPGTSGARQIDADKLRIRPNRGRWRCNKCQRAQVRPTPNDACLAHRCDGTLFFEEDDKDDYNLATLDGGFALLKPAEHTAQVPHEERERLEHLFKGEGDVVNTLVGTPTLELGVDIGGLDTVLLRNVPPLPANYWQRVGRAGRRHRLAVNITYARPASHDRNYFSDPAKLLDGRVEPPRFNLKNELMLGKHVRAAVITHLHTLARPESGLSVFDRDEIRETLRTVLPGLIKSYLFDESGLLLPGLFDVSPLAKIVTKHQDALVSHVEKAFKESWPEDDSEIVSSEKLTAAVLGTAKELEENIRRIKKRLDWALRQMEELDEIRRKKATLDPDEDALYARCDRMVKRLKGVDRRGRREAEGYDDTITYGALAAEGFLPGYGLETGSILATTMSKFSELGADFKLPRPPANALREYVPGNLIYANENRYVVRQFHLEAQEPTQFQVDTVNEAVQEIGLTGKGGGVSVMGASALPAVPICDVELAHVSRITDEEDYRFQLPVTIYGYELDRHGAGKRNDWGGQDVTFRRGVHLRLVNVGATRKVEGLQLGYPVSLVTGQSRSPFSSQREIEEFAKMQEERYGKKLLHVGFYADSVSDCLALPGLSGRAEAYSVLEALRVGMSQVLEMEREDVGVLVIGEVGLGQVTGILYDPMPGGSGLLEQACERWDEVVAEALQVTDHCPSGCSQSCSDCLQIFRNAYYHRYLDRRKASERLREWGSELKLQHEIPAKMPDAPPPEGKVPVNQAEETLKGMLKRAGFPAGEWHHEIALGKPLGNTYPDVFFPDDEGEPGVCLYLDGLSQHIHGNKETAKKDRAIRDQLRSLEYEVFEIAATELTDRDAMARHFFRLARVLMGKEKARDVRNDPSWFAEG